jgi:hypothetical protein
MRARVWGDFDVLFFFIAIAAYFQSAVEKVTPFPWLTHATKQA